ncbi:MAG TPA: FkbM family methyltransferase [Candidatus Saccharimonadales bacterium]|nr:FkbM family methyltransferase [Candidatus Saccharimonadales bacterium]
MAQTSKPLVTYSQNREDFFLWALIGHRKNGFYVDVGAHDPELHSVTKLFYDRGWSGINIEANPHLFKPFPRARKRDINLNVGVADKKQLLVFRRYPHHPGFSTFSEYVKKEHESEQIPHVDEAIPARPLKDIFREYKVKKIDFMSIDVEGFEVEVIKGNDWEKYRPNVMVLEATMRKKVNPLLKSLGYKLEFFDGLNNYYVDTRSTEQLTIYRYAPTILASGFYTTFEDRLQKQLRKLSDELDQKNREYELINSQLNEMKRLRNQPKNLAKASRAFLHYRLNRK